MLGDLSKAAMEVVAVVSIIIRGFTHIALPLIFKITPWRALIISTLHRQSRLPVAGAHRSGPPGS